MAERQEMHRMDHWRILLLVAGVLLLAFIGIALGKLVSRYMLHADAESTTGDWANSLVLCVDDFPSILMGKGASPVTTRLLMNATQVGNVYRFRLWSSNGQLLFEAERKGFQQQHSPHSITEMEEDQRMAGRLLYGERFTTLVHNNQAGDPEYYAHSYLPFLKDGRVVAVFEAYLDQTEDHALYVKAFFFTELIIGLLVLFAGGIPAVLVYRKMIDHRAAQAEALFLAEHDPLTGLANRKRLESQAEKMLAYARRTGTNTAALVIDLDRFKEVNDGLGHAAGDTVLRQMASRLASSLRQSDLVARFGGDEFVVVQVGIAQPKGACALSRRLMRALSAPYMVDGIKVECGASIGVAIAPIDADRWEQLLVCADTALYQAKDQGRSTVRFFERGMDEEFRKRRQLETDLRRALEGKSFELAFQPLVSFHDGHLIGFEALLRWPKGWPGCDPATFIPVAEECGLIVPIGTWVLENACKAAAGWEKPLKLAVNVSPLQFRYGHLVADVERALRLSGLKPELLELEITESLWLQDSDSVLRQLSRLREIGVSIVLDDFGTDYSSLFYLWKFPLSTVKIDRSFVARMKTDPKAQEIVSTIIGLGRTLDLTVTAEGVETAAQAEALHHAGCDQAQGFLYSRPLSAAAAAELAAGNPAWTQAGLPGDAA